MTPGFWLQFLGGGRSGPAALDGRTAEGTGGPLRPGKPQGTVTDRRELTPSAQRGRGCRGGPWSRTTGQPTWRGRCLQALGLSGVSLSGVQEGVCVASELH